MKKRELSIIIAIGSLIITDLVISAILFATGNSKYLIFSGAVLLILGSYLLLYLNSTKSEDAVYNKELSNIIKTYYSVLAEVKEFPELKRKEVIRLSNLDDLLNVQEETEKPIFYMTSDKSASFFIIDDNVTCIYTLKMNDTIVDPVEKKMFEKTKDLYVSLDDSVLEDIDNTTIIKINNKFLKVSPVRGKDLEKTLIIPKLK